MVSLPYEKDFSEQQIPTKARPIQMNLQLLDIAKKRNSRFISQKFDSTKSFSMELCNFLCSESF